MWIEEVGPKKYRYYERYLDPYTQKQKRVSVTLTSKSNQAKKQAMMELQEKIDNKVLANQQKKITLRQLHDEWFPVYTQRVKRQTYYSASSLWKKIFNELEEDLIIQNVDSAFFQNYLDDVYYNKDYSFSYTDGVRAQFSIAFDYAKLKGYISENPLRNVRIVKKKKDIINKNDMERKYLEPDELKLVLEELSKRKRSKNFMRYAEGMELLSITGMRYGEMAALKEEDFNGHALNINKTLFYNYGSLKDGATDTPKNIYSYRTVELTDRGIEIVEDWIEENHFRKQVSPHYKDMGFIYTAITGTPIHVGHLNTRLREIRKDFKEAGIMDKKLTTHIFRHTHISYLSSIGVPLKTIMERVGHESPSTTLKIYTHVTKKAQSDLMNLLNEKEKENEKDPQDD